nr:terminase family protein [bacterium]
MDNCRLQHIVAQLERAQGGARLARYNAGPRVHQKQMAFHACPRRNRWVFGGNRTGKTECGAVEAVWHARGIHPFRDIRRPTVGWVVSPTHEVQRDVAQKKLLDYLDPAWIGRVVMRTGGREAPEGGVLDYLTIKSVHGGQSTIAFKSCDQGREKFQGASLDWVWFDEEPPQDIYAECR